MPPKKKKNGAAIGLVYCRYPGNVLNGEIKYYYVLL